MIDIFIFYCVILNFDQNLIQFENNKVNFWGHLLH